ncbi:lig_chan-Glu_bd domain-containing protein [Trichonephila inaurata madagascariensis]|uniref:Lig_chan-Glu_bd domain-containing protein n=2 Tax=Trichonephila inaurata madagascariensis TaxID=2747483 RepID=A0A8X6I5K7_9ARAC|nr:lig_chan-Glu_bd domain-containing protein [Trichonephila inaurata madagascariensis]
MKFPSILKVAIVPTKYIIEINKDENNITEISGYEGYLLKLLSSTLGFKYEIFAENEWGVLNKDGNWTGVLGLLQRKEVDVGLSVTMTNTRLNTVQFSRSYGKEDVTFIVSKPTSSLKTSNFWYLAPFESNIWIFISLYLILTSVILSAINKKSNFLFLKTFFSLLGSLMKQPISSGKSVLLGCWLFLSTMMTLCYSALLLSYLTLPLNMETIRNFEELSKAVQLGKYRCFVEKGSAIGISFRESKQEHFRLLFENVERNNWFLKRSDDMLRKGLGKNTAFISHRSILEILNAMWGSDAYEVSEDVFASVNYGIAGRKDFCCIHILSKELSRIEASHLREQMRKNVFLKLNTAHESLNKYNDPSPITYENIKDLILILISGYLIASVAFLAEIVYFNVNKKRKRF